jgi:hypothetical protein
MAEGLNLSRKYFLFLFYDRNKTFYKPEFSLTLNSVIRLIRSSGKG